MVPQYTVTSYGSLLVTMAMPGRWWPGPCTPPLSSSGYWSTEWAFLALEGSGWGFLGRVGVWTGGGGKQKTGRMRVMVTEWSPRPPPPSLCSCHAGLQSRELGVGGGIAGVRILRSTAGNDLKRGNEQVGGGSRAQTRLLPYREQTSCLCYRRFSSYFNKLALLFFLITKAACAHSPKLQHYRNSKQCDFL